MNYRLIHSETEIIAIIEDIGDTATPFTIFTGTLTECLAEVGRLNLADPSDALAPFLEYQKLRQEAYIAEGATAEALSVALWEKEEGKPEEWNRLQAIRLAIKERFPKP